MSFFQRFDPVDIEEAVRYYLTVNPARAKRARSVGFDNVVQETMVNLLRYPPKRDVLMSNGCYWTASYTLTRMLAQRRPVKPAGLLYDVPDAYDESMEELWVAVRKLLSFKIYDPLYRFFHGETQLDIAKEYGVHPSVIYQRIKLGIRRLRHEPSKGIQFFLTGDEALTQVPSTYEVRVDDDK